MSLGRRRSRARAAQTPICAAGSVRQSAAWIPEVYRPWRLSARHRPLRLPGGVTVDRWVRGSTVHTTDRVAEEVPVALLYNGEPHVVMLATPHDLETSRAAFR